MIGEDGRRGERRAAVCSESSSECVVCTRSHRAVQCGAALTRCGCGA